MDYKMYRSFFVLCIFLFSNAHAQNNDTLTQTIVWDEVAYASKYDVMLEKQNEQQEWVSHTIYETTKNTLDLHLPIGSYRYKIIVYNILGRAEPSTEWFDFSIYKAYQPVVKHILPEIFFLNENTDGIMQVTGAHFVYNSVFTLEKRNGEKLYGAVVKIEGDSIYLDFDEHRLESGTYTFKVTNPGGLIDDTKKVQVQLDNVGSSMLHIGYAPSYIYWGGDMLDLLDASFSFLGCNAAFSYFFTESKGGDFGLTLSLNAIQLNQSIETYIVQGSLLPFSLRVAYRYPLEKDKLFLSFNVGAGFTLLHNMYVKSSSSSDAEALTAIGITPGAGLGMQYYIHKNIYINAGFDYMFAYFDDTNNIQMIAPSLSVGWKF